VYDTIEIARALTAQARRDSSLLLLVRLPSLDPARGGAVAESGDGDGRTCCCFWRTQRGTARSREDGARGGRAGLLLTRARCEMIGLARQRRRGPAQRGAAGAPSDGGDGRRMEAAWLASIIPRAPGQIKIHYCSPASRRVATRHRAGRGSCHVLYALQSPSSHCSTLVHRCTVHMDHYLFFPTPFRASQFLSLSDASILMYETFGRWSNNIHRMPNLFGLYT